MNTSLIVLVYSIYLPVAIILTFYVAKVLFNGGKIFMIDIFRGREDIALATNRMFQMGFYLLNIGFALLVLKTFDMAEDSQDVIEILSLKIGKFSIYLGIMLFLNLFLFFRGKRKSREGQLIAARITTTGGSQTKNPEI